MQNIEVILEPLTVITGLNNAGKTSFNKALQIALGNRQFITQDDFYISETNKIDEIVIDVKIIPIGNAGEKINIFSDSWNELFTEHRIVVNEDGEEYVPLRTKVKMDPLTNSPKTKQYILQEWVNDKGKEWYQVPDGTEKQFHFDEMPFFYMDAQRDIIEDLKIRNSYLGKMLSKIEYSDKDIEKIEKQIKELNEQAVQNSDILLNIESTLKDLDTAMDNNDKGIDITPFPKKVRDLNKGVSIQYCDFSMDYHGMGTRSWSSLLMLKSFISLFTKNSNDKEKPFFPIIAIEEPEAHLHPNAQKKLFSQISEINGQKIISTHSSYIAGTAGLEQIRSFYKKENNVICGAIEIGNYSLEEIRKIKRQVINTRGELFFSKVIVFFEGETEEQVLPIFAEKYFGKTSVEIGIDFIGVGGHGNYLPFLRVAESLNIPWFILSDAENSSGSNVKKSVQKQFKECTSSKLESDCIVFLDNDNNFEKQLIADGYSDEIKAAIINITPFDNDQHKEVKSKEINAYDNNKLYETIINSKTQLGPAVADLIIENKKGLPSKVTELFDKIKKMFQIGD